MEFSRPKESYTYMKIAARDFNDPESLPEGYRFTADVDRDQERALLQSEFPHWQIPFEKKMPGFREDGTVAVVHDGRLVAIVYTCDVNDLQLPGYSQGHYAVVEREHRGFKLFHAMFTEMLRRTEEWGQEGMMFIHDRVGHRDMYEAWGAEVVQEREKQEPTRTAAAPSRLRRLAGAVRRRVGG